MCVIHSVCVSLVYVCDSVCVGVCEKVCMCVIHSVCVSLVYVCDGVSVGVCVTCVCV